MYFRVRLHDSGGGGLFDTREEAEAEVKREEEAEPDDRGVFEIAEEWHMPGDVKAMPDFDGSY